MEGLVEVPEDIFDIFGADGKAHEIGSDTGARLLFFVELTVGSDGGVDGEGLGVADVGQVAEELQGFNELLASFSAAFDAKTEDGPGAFGQEFLASCAIRAAFEAGVSHPGDFGVFLEPFGDLLGIGDMAIDAQA